MGNAAAVAVCSFILFIVHTSAPPANPEILEQPCTKQSSSSVKMYQMHIQANVRNRFAHTTVTTKVMNCERVAEETTFSMVLPKAAFISGFVMEVNGKNYTAYVKEKDEAKQTYSTAISSGLGAAHVAVNVRDSNEITVSVNVEPRTKAAFYLTYEELLIRRNGQYEIVINLRPGQLVPDLSVMVYIAESRKITNLHIPNLRSGNEIENYRIPGSFMPFLKTLNDNTAKVGFSPNLEKQKELAGDFLSLKEELACQFVVAYDVERDPKGGEVLVQDGYFVHFFAPSNLKRLPKLVVFVLDTSYSMKSRGKINQLQDAMHVILDDLKPDDAFHLVEFNTDTNVWVLENPPRTIKYTSDNIETLMGNYQQHKAYTGNPENIRKAKAAVSLFKPTGWTDIYKTLRISIGLVQLSKMLSTIGVSHQPMIIFLTDGDPTTGEKSTSKILKDITKFNTGLRKTPIFTLSFGNNANRTFLETLALSNSAFPRHIYEAADASLQLQNFYTEISSPLLANVAFKYHSSSNNLTETEFPLHFRGAELVTAGRYDPNARKGKSARSLVVNAWNGEDELSFVPTVQQSTSSIERLWAYLTVKQLLEKKDNPEMQQEELNQKAIELSLKYSFVTSVTSLVVVKPNGTDSVDITEVNEPLSSEEQISEADISMESANVYIRLEENFLQYQRPVVQNTYHSVQSVAYPEQHFVPEQPYVQHYVPKQQWPVPVQTENFLQYQRPVVQNTYHSVQSVAYPEQHFVPEQPYVQHYVPKQQWPVPVQTENFLQYQRPVVQSTCHSVQSVACPERNYVPGQPYVQHYVPIQQLPLPVQTDGWPNVAVAPPMFLFQLEENGWLNLPEGRYKLGANKTLKQARTCSNSLLNSQGNCRLLHLCVDDSMSLRIDDYRDHFCVVKNQYAGICCPDGWLSEN